MTLTVVFVLGAVGGCRDGRRQCCLYRPDGCTTPVTASVVGARAVDVSPVQYRRAFEPVRAPYADGTVTHGPLFFEDPREDGRSTNGIYDEWTTEDVAAVFAGAGHFGANLVLYPLSFIGSPPWTTVTSE